MAFWVAVVLAAIKVRRVVDLAMIIEFFAGIGMVDIAAFALHVVDAVIDGPLGRDG